MTFQFPKIFFSFLFFSLYFTLLYFLFFSFKTFFFLVPREKRRKEMKRRKEKSKERKGRKRKENFDLIERKMKFRTIQYKTWIFDSFFNISHLYWWNWYIKKWIFTDSILDRHNWGLDVLFMNQKSLYNSNRILNFFLASFSTRTNNQIKNEILWTMKCLLSFSCPIFLFSSFLCFFLYYFSPSFLFDSSFRLPSFPYLVCNIN